MAMQIDGWRAATWTLGVKSSWRLHYLGLVRLTATETSDDESY